MQGIHGLFLSFICFLAVSNSLRAQTGAGDTHHDATLVEKQLRLSAEAVTQTVVRVKSNSEHATSGVIVSVEGHVLWPGSGHKQPDLSVVLQCGETVAATNLGWSGEWQVGLLKLKGGRRWPHAKFGSTEQAVAGDKCFEIGYHAKEDKDGFARLPDVRFGKLKLISPSHWFATSLEPKHLEYGAGTFDTEGRLLGISVPGVSMTDHLSTAVEIFTSHWEHFTNGKNLDWVRYPPSKNSLYRNLSEPNRLDRTGILPRAEVPGWKERTGKVLGRYADAEAAKIGDPQFKEGEVLPAIDEKDFLNARNVAATTTVRIIQKSQKDRVWSGVIVSSEGHITTCAHTHQVPGEELVVVLPDSRQVPAVALGTNWVSDIGLVKITEEGPWNYAEFGDSSIIGPEGAVLCAGFPSPHVIPLPPVTTATLGLQQTPYVGWTDNLMVALSLKLMGGSSGGGVFNRDGQLVGIYLGPGGVRRIEVFRAQEEFLNGGTTMIVDSVVE